METLKISDTKCKVTLSRADAEAFGIARGGIDISLTETRERLCDLLVGAGRGCGVDLTVGRLLIQLFPSADGGCEIFASALGDCTEGEVSSLRSSVRGDTDEKIIRRGRFSVGIYEFSECTSLLSVCGRLSARGDVGESAVYVAGEPSRWFLVMCEGASERSFDGVTDAIADEYGGKRLRSEAYAYIKEHAQTVLVSGAVRRLGSLC